MGIIDKVMFWKKKDEFDDLDIPTGPGPELGGAPGDFGSDLGKSDLGPPPDFGSGPLADTHINPSPVGEITHQGPAAMQPTNLEPKQDFMISKDLEIISSKLDAIRASLDSLNQRLGAVEKMAEGGQFKRSQW